MVKKSSGTSWLETISSNEGSGVCMINELNLKGLEKK